MPISEGTVSLRGRRWQYNFVVDGKQIRRAAKAAKTEDEARACLDAARRSFMRPPKQSEVKPWHVKREEFPNWDSLVDKASTRSNSWLGFLHQRARDRAAKNRWLCLSKEEFVRLARSTGGRCQVSGIQFDWTVPVGSGTPPFAPSLDRVHSDKGYELENVRLVCWAVNIGMCDWGVDTYRRVCKAVAG